MRIGLYADGGASVGLGHIGRCAALAQAFQRAGADAVFVDLAVECRPWARKHGFSWASASSGRWDLIVVDSYRIKDAAWLLLRSRARTMLVIDDFGTLSKPCDWILN